MSTQKVRSKISLNDGLKIASFFTDLAQAAAAKRQTTITYDTRALGKLQAAVDAVLEEMHAPVLPGPDYPGDVPPAAADPEGAPV